MEFESFDSFSELFNYPIESLESPVTSTCDFQNNGGLLSECTMIDRYGCDHLWSYDDKFTSLDSKSTLSSVVIAQDVSQYPTQSPLLNYREKKSSDIPQSEPLVTKTNHFLCKDDFLWNDSKELPANILVLPREENTHVPDSIRNTFLNSDSVDLNSDFEREFLNSIQVENEGAVDSNTKVDVEFLDNLLNGFSDQPQNIDTNAVMKTSNYEVGSSNPSSFNEISCNIIQQDVATETKCAIKALLKDTSFKGNFLKKKSTEILSEITQSHHSFAEHNYFSSTKVSKPQPSNIDSDTPHDNSTNGIVPAVFSAAQVPIFVEDFAVETVIISTSTPSNDSPNLKIPAVVSSHCKIPASVASPKSIKPVKKVNKKLVVCKTDPDPTYKPNAKRKKPVKKSTSPKNKLNVNPSKKLVAQEKKFDTCGIAEFPKISTKSAGDTKPKSVESSKSEGVPKVALQVPETSINLSTSPQIHPTPVWFAGPSTPLASPTKDDVMDHELNDKDSKDSNQPQTDTTVDSTQPEDETPKIEKKKISLKEYMKTRAPKTTTDPEPTPEPTKSITMAPVANVEEILRTIVKPQPLRIDDVLKTIAKSTPIPVVKSDPVLVANKPALVVNKPTAVVKSEPVSKPAKILKTCEPKKEPIRKRDENSQKKPATKPQRNPTIVSKPIKQPVNNVPLKLIRVAVPERVPSIRPHSISPNEVSQSSDSCDRFSSSGFSSCRNSSVSSSCRSPYPGYDDKSNDTKYSYSSEKIDMSKQRKTEKKELQIPFAVNKELLREEDRSSNKYKYRRDRDRRSNSKTRKRKYSDSCFEDDSDSSDYSGRKRFHSRKRYVSSSSSSSSSSVRSHHYKSHNAGRSIFRDRKYQNAEMIAEPYCYNYKELPNAFYPSLISIPWHPGYGPVYPAYVPNMEVPYYYNGYHEPGREVVGDMEIQTRTLFVGSIAEEVSEKSLHKRFSKFGKIEHIRIHNRDPKNIYAFVYYKDQKHVQDAIRYGNDDPTVPHYKLGVGMRKDRYAADRRSFTYDKAPITITNFQTPRYQEQKDTSYGLKLEQMKNDLKQNGVDSRYK